MSATWSKAPPGVAEFFTPCLVLAATVATALSQLGLPVGGLSFTIALYLVFDFISFRFGRKVPPLQKLRASFSLPGGSTLTAATGADEGAKVEAQPQPTHAMERRVRAETSPSAKASPPAASSAAQSKGLRMSMQGREDIFANAESPIEFENEFFKGRMLFLLRCSPPNPKWDPHFEGKNRMFEMQIQGKLKLLPKGEVYMGGELDERPKQGLVTQTVSKIVMGFAKQMVKSLHYSFGERRPPSDPLEAESPHVTFPLYRVMDWFVVTPEAEAPPALGGDVVELPEERAARRGGRSPDIEWKTDVTYTMCFHSNTVNFQEWSVINVPGQGSLDLNTFLCKQPVSVVVYDFTAANASAAHKARDKSYMFRCTLSNESPGYVARPAVCESPSKTAGMPRSERGVGVDCLEGDESDDCGMSADREALESAAVGVASSDEQTDHDRLSSSRRLLLSLEGAGGASSIASSSVLAPSVASAGSSPRKSYYVPAFPTPEDKEASSKGLVKSGDILPLLMGGGDVPATPQNANHLDPATNVAFLGEGSGGGVAMLKGNAMPAGVQVFKVGGGVGTFRSDFFYGGDVVVLQHPVSRKFVRIGRAWVLAWSSKASASKIHFVVKGIDSRRPLAHGQAFSLVSRRWSDWEVGVSKQPSSKLGGWSLGCLNKGKRRNVTRLSLLTLVARPWLDPAADLAGGQGRGVIPALEAEENAMTISHRGPFEDAPWAEEEEEDDDDDDGSDPPRSEVDDGLSESDPECCSDADKAETERRLASYRSFSEDGLSSKAARAMTCYPDEVSSLRVGIPAWVEFFHRERRQGLLAFVVAVHGVPHPLLSSPSTTTKTATDSSNTTTTTTAESGDGNLPSPARATITPAWTCLRTSIELSRSVEAYRECIEPSQISGSWQSKAPPRVFQHMGKADQSVRLINHEISEIQRWEALFRSKGKPERPPAILDPSSSPSAQDHGSLAPNPNDDKTTSPSSATGKGGGSILESVGSASSPGGKSSTGDGYLSSPSRLHGSPGRLAGSSGTELPASSAAAARTSDGVSVVHETARSGASGDPSPACLPRDEPGGGRGKGLTAPYRLLCEAVSVPGELDRHFLSGSSAADLGVTVEVSSGTPTLGSAVARCLSESHWREEWAVLFPSHVACYPALSMKPSWVLPLKTLFKVSSVSDERCPFPGLRGLRLETIGRAYYLCFANCSSRDNWLSEILRLSKGGTVDPPSALELPQDHREMYVLKTTQSRAPARLILNARRPGFDIPDGVFRQGNRPGESDAGASLQGGSSHQQHQHQQQQPWQLSAEVLRSAFTVSADPGIEQLVPFLDLASTFRKIDLSSLDLDSDEALCFFANLYHLLVMHMLLVLGPPPSSKEWPLNYVQVSYEVGGDVFSLQELEHCVLRGKLPRPNLKDLPKRFAPLPPENDEHYFYSLTKADDRMSLFLNNGSQSNPPVVVLLTPSTMNEQLNSACKAFVDHTVKTDPKRRQILVHKAFQLYARDLKSHGTSKDMVRYGLRFAGRSVVQALSLLDVDISQAHIRYHPYLLKCHENENMTLLDVPDAPA